MGLLRIILALFVVISHTTAYHSVPCINGPLAVKIFFVVSGFYMALILGEKYTRNGHAAVGLFYSNRALRIFPLLWIALALELTRTLLPGSRNSMETVPWLHILFQMAALHRFGLFTTYVLTQVTSLGVDTMHLFSLTSNDTLFRFTGPVQAGQVRGWQGYPMSHTWSISCELIFYLVVPMLLRLRTWPLAIIGGALLAVARVGGHFIAPPFAECMSDYWAPLQMPYFILGLFAYRLYRSRFLEKIPHLLQWLIPAAFLGNMLFYNIIAGKTYTGSMLGLFLTAFLSIPILFRRFKSVKFDRSIGELSYPVYLQSDLCQKLFRFKAETGFLACFLVMTLSVALSALSLWAIGNRLEDLRQRRARRELAQNPLPQAQPPVDPANPAPSPTSLA